MCADPGARAAAAARRGDHGAALAAARLALACDPAAVAPWNIAGTLAVAAGDLPGALTAFGRASALDEGPRSALNLAMAFERAQRWHEALAVYRALLRRFPGHAKAAEREAAVSGHLDALAGRLLAQARAARERGDPGEAERRLRRALAIRPEDGPEAAEVLLELHGLWSEQGRPERACRALRRAVAAQPDAPAAYAHLAAAALAAGDAGAAEAVSRRGLTLRPAATEPLMSRGEILLELDRLEEAEAALAAACDLTAGRDPRAVYALAHVRLLRGDLARGFDGYMARWAALSATRTFPVPPWDGRRPLDGRLYLWAPSGVGDQVLFSGMLADVRAAGIDAVVECDPRWRPVWRRSFPWVTVVDRPETPGAALAADGVAAHFPLAGLGRWFRRDMAAFPADRRRYLAADAERAAALRARYRRLGDGPLIGLSWRSRTSGLGDRKTVPLTDWAPIVTAPGAPAPVFVNLQYGDCRGDLRALEEACGVSVFHDDTIDQMADLDAFTAQVAALDLVITVSNTAAHVAGALGVPCWMLAPCGRATLWHWFAGRADSPWYPSMRIFRQSVASGWAPAVEAVAAGLAAFLRDPLTKN